MRTSERLRALKAWAYENLCEGRQMKAPGENMDIADIRTQEPQVYIGWQPTRPDATGHAPYELQYVAPGILIMPDAGHAKYVEEKRFDRYNKVRRPQEMGQWLNVSMLFGVYEPGIRLPGFREMVEDEDGEHSYRIDMQRILEGTQEGLMTLVDWMDDCVSGLLNTGCIPGSDLALDETNLTYGLYSDQSYVVDKRPIFYGFVNAKFSCYADDGNNSIIEGMLN